ALPCVKWNSAGLHLAAAREGPAERDLVRVLEVAADGQPAREAGDADAAAEPVGEIACGGLAGHVRVGGQHDLLDAVPFHAREQLVDPQVLRLDAVERRKRAAEDVVEAAELGRSLEREQVGRLLDDADHGVVAARVEADRADLLLRQVPALAAEANALLDLDDRGGERERLVLGHAQQMEGEPLRGARPDPRQASQLRDEVVDGRGEHGGSVPRCPGWTTRAPSVTPESHFCVGTWYQRSRRQHARAARPLHLSSHLRHAFASVPGTDGRYSRPGRPRPPRAPPARPPRRDSIRDCAERIASFVAASTMSSSICGSSGSIAFGSIFTSTISSAPVALTATIPPPADASTVSFASSSCAFAIWLCISCTCWSILFT